MRQVPAPGRQRRELRTALEEGHVPRRVDGNRIDGPPVDPGLAFCRLVQQPHEDRRAGRELQIDLSRSDFSDSGSSGHRIHQNGRARIRGKWNPCVYRCAAAIGDEVHGPRLRTAGEGTSFPRDPPVPPDGLRRVSIALPLTHQKTTGGQGPKRCPPLLQVRQAWHVNREPVLKDDVRTLARECNQVLHGCDRHMSSPRAPGRLDMTRRGTTIVPFRDVAACNWRSEMKSNE